MFINNINIKTRKLKNLNQMHSLIMLFNTSVIYRVFFLNFLPNKQKVFILLKYKLAQVINNK